MINALYDLYMCNRNHGKIVTGGDFNGSLLEKDSFISNVRKGK